VVFTDRSETLTGFLVHLQTADGLSNRCYLLSIPWTARKDDPQVNTRRLNTLPDCVE